jgi:uncharacterized protein (TIGR03067 family)
MLRLVSFVVFAALAAPTARAEEPKSPQEALRGVWLFEEAQLKKRSELGRVWESVLTISGDGFALSQLMGSRRDLTGKVALDPKDPRAIDLKVAELDLSALLPGYRVPAGTLAGIYKLAGDHLTLCLARDYTCQRPTTFEANADQYLLTLTRAPKGFMTFPKELKVTVIGADGRPFAGATVCQSLRHWDYEGRIAPLKWEYSGERKCGSDGTAVIPREKLRSGVLIGRDGAGAIGFASVSPARLATGELRVELQPQVRVTGTMTCGELVKAGEPLGWAGGYLLRDGRPVGAYSSKDGKFEFIAAPGKYTLNLAGSKVGGKFIDVTVPGDRSEYAVGEVAMEALAFALLKGKPAPEFEGAVGWKGEKVRFADLKGKYVLVDFWGYWCGPCVGSMPVLIELHEKYAGKGLAIVGVHVDIGGEVDTAAKLDAKLASVKKERWKGKDIPFPSVLVSGRRGEGGKWRGPVTQYGVQGFPTCLLIDREGKVVREFHARDIKKASEEIEKLLAKTK